jgi:hypothetical protein
MTKEKAYEFGSIAPDAKIEATAEQAKNDRQSLLTLLEYLLPTNKDKNLRFESFKVLLVVGEKYPQVLYQFWDSLVDLLTSGNSSCMFNALYLIARVIGEDRTNRFDEIFDVYFNIINHPSVALASQVTVNAGRIAKAKPALRQAITQRLIAVDNTPHTEGHKGVIKAHAIRSLSMYIDEMPNKQEIAEYVAEQSKDKSAGVKKAVKEFMSLHKY